MRRIRQQSNLKNTRAIAYLLSIAPGPSVAYSFRKLSSTYVGPCCRIRRSTDNAETDIDFLGSWVNEQQIINFSPNAGEQTYLVRWYDQSGNANHLTQTTALNQCVVSINGVINKTNNKPTIKFNGLNNFYNLTTPLVLPAIWTSHRVTTAAADAATMLPYLSNSATGPNDVWQYLIDKTLNAWGNRGSVFTGSMSGPIAQSCLSFTYDDTNSSLYQNNTNIPVTRIGAAATLNFEVLGPAGAAGNVQEYVFYSSDQRLKRANIVTNQNNAFNVF